MNNTDASAGTAPPQQYPVIDQLSMGLKNLLRSMEPSPEVLEHFRNARIEVLKGLRQIIDNRIQRLHRTGQHGQKITVE